MVAFKSQPIVNVKAIDASAATEIQRKIQEIYSSDEVYSEALVVVLEDYLTEQKQNSYVDIDANLMLLRLYLIYKDLKKTDKVYAVLVKSLSALPSLGFVGVASLLSSQARKNKDIETLLQAGYTLQACKFEDFWKLRLGSIDKFPGFHDSIRHYILSVVKKTHQSISVTTLKAMLHVSEQEAIRIASEEKWTVKDQVIFTPLDDEEQLQYKRIHESIECKDALQIAHALIT